MNTQQIREWAAALRADLIAHGEHAGEAAQFRNTAGSWEDVEDRLDALDALLPDGDGPAALLVGDAPIPLSGGGAYLITVWQDGTGEMAWRPDPRATWGAPAPLRPAP